MYERCHKTLAMYSNVK